jgi:hypothetical protein
MTDMVCGANEEGYHLTGVAFGRDLPQPASVADIRNVVEGDPLAGRQGNTRTVPRHRSRPHLPATHQVCRSAEMHLPRRAGQGPGHGNGLLRHRRVAHRRRRHRAGPRRARHRLSCWHSALRRGYRADELRQIGNRSAPRRPRSMPNCSPPASMPSSTIATSAPARCSPTGN